MKIIKHMIVAGVLVSSLPLVTNATGVRPYPIPSVRPGPVSPLKPYPHPIPPVITPGGIPKPNPAPQQQPPNPVHILPFPSK